MKWSRLSWCKINLLLNILGRRPDGFHDLETVFQPLPVHDELELERAGGSGPESRIELSCSDPRLPVDGQNLVHRAARVFLETAGIQETVRLRLEKRIPLAAGLGGGSGNAATTLLLLNEAFGFPLEAGRLQAIATRLGSDVPFFLQNRPALATGRGEVIQPLDDFPALHGVHVLLIHPGFGVSTAWAYSALARFPDALNGRPGRARDLAVHLQGRDLGSAAGGFYNSLEVPVLEKHPILALYQEFLRDHGAPVARMSGSGSTTFALVEQEAKAVRIGEQFQERFGAQGWTRIVRIGGTGS